MADRRAVAEDLELPVDDPVVDAFMEGLTDDGAGRPRLPDARIKPRRRAMYHLMRARQSDQWAALAAARTPTLLLLATKPDDLRATNETAGARFQAAVLQADVRMIEGASHSLITDLREGSGAWSATGWRTRPARLTWKLPILASRSVPPFEG